MRIRSSDGKSQLNRFDMTMAMDVLRAAERSSGSFIMRPDPVPVNVSVESERFLARLKLFGAEDFADEEV